MSYENGIHINTELKSKIANPSDMFLSFIAQYFEDGMYLSRGEWNPDLPQKLEGEEFEVAKELIAANIDVGEPAILYAARVLDMKELIPHIKENFEKSVAMSDKYNFANGLRDWGDVDQFVPFCKQVMSMEGEAVTKETVMSGSLVTMNKKDAVDVLCIGLRDADKNIRESALHYMLQIGKVEIEYADYYTANEVYQDKDLLEARIAELREKVLM